MRPLHDELNADYCILVSRAWQRPRAEVYLFNLRQTIPDILIPLKPDQAEPVLPLNPILHDLYDRAAYDLAIDYTLPPLPPLSPADALWQASLV